MDTAPLDPRIGKNDAVWELGRRALVPVANRWDSETVPPVMARVRERVAAYRNAETKAASAAELGLNWMSVHAPAVRHLAPAVFLNGPPDCFGAQARLTAFSPEYKLLPVENGYVGHFFGAAVVLTPDGQTIVEDVSSRFNGLYQYYDFDAAAVLKDAPFIDGIVIPIADDIRPLNFCHWLIDWLPRLEFLGAHSRDRSVYVVTTPLIAQFQRDSLRMCGFDESRVIILDDYQAIRARQLLVPSDLRDIDHPLKKGASWAVSYLRSTIGMESLLEARGPRGKLYVSRADASRRRVVNDAELVAALARYGYRSVTLSELSLAEQAAHFAGATHVISLHGAGLSNLVFSSPGTRVIEIFPKRYGILSFAVLAASMEMPYATYVADGTEAADITQFDDVVVDVPRFLEACEGFL